MRRGGQDSDTHRENDPTGTRGEDAVHSPGGEASGGTNPVTPRSGTPHAQTLVQAVKSGSLRPAATAETGRTEGSARASEGRSQVADAGIWARLGKGPESCTVQACPRALAQLPGCWPACSGHRGLRARATRLRDGRGNATHSLGVQRRVTVRRPQMLS